MGAFKKLVMINETRFKTIMHSKRMRTACGSSHLWGGGLPQCMLGYIPPRCGPGDPPWVWAWRPPWVCAWRPPGSGPGDPLGLGLEIPLGQTPQLPPLGVGLETCKACWDTTPRDLLQGMQGYHLQCMLGYHPPPPVNRILDTCY